MNSFYEHHKHNIQWHYRCFDRILLNGVIQPFQRPERVVGFFNTYRQLYPVTRQTLRGIAEQFQRWVSERAAMRKIPVVEAPKGRRDDFVDPYFERAKPDQVVVILKAREPARIMIAIGDKIANRWHLQIADVGSPSTISTSMTRYGDESSYASAPISHSPLGFVSISITGWRIACDSRALRSTNLAMPF